MLSSNSIAKVRLRVDRPRTPPKGGFVKLVKGVLAAVMVAGMMSAAAPSASAQPTVTEMASQAGSIQVVDHDGRPLSAESVGYGASGQAQAANPPLGSSFDGYVSGVRVHFSNAYQWLDRGGSWRFGNARLSMQSDGNLVLYDVRNNTARWASNTRGSGATRMLFQPDDNLVLYTAGEAARWATNTTNDCGSLVPLLALQEDSNFVIYCGQVSGGTLRVHPIWATNTRF
ncbi:hypothetical protein AB0M31_20860 [Streptomyces sp. NPDC051773]|uniref:hypothetical protein n=1 Tax=Streptomyces sp. NPDC051773 TaxID=3156682 RepID=UPI00342B4CA9